VTILPQLIVNSIIAGAIYTLVAIGFNLIYGTVKFFDLGYGALTAVGGYAAFLFHKKLGLDLALSIILAVLLTGAIGWLVNQLGDYIFRVIHNSAQEAPIFAKFVAQKMASDTLIF